MKNLKISILLFAVIAMSALSSCKKEEDPNAIHVPAPPGPPTTSQVSSVQLNGGYVLGRWNMTFEQVVTLRNDTLQNFDTLTYPQGEFTAEFTNNQLILIDTFLIDTVIYPYSISGNHITLVDGPNLIVLAYGISPQGVMRWSFEDAYTSGSNSYRIYEDYLLER